MVDLRLPFLRRVVLHNYKSICDCDLRLSPLTLLVGPNGVGKSNFVDALRFVAESLRTTMDQALRERGGIQEVRRRSRGHPTHFTIELEALLPTGETANYGFEVGAKRQGGFEVRHEHCTITGHGNPIATYRVENGVVTEASFHPRPPASTDRLYLTIASGFPEFRGLYDCLTGMGFYNINPDQLRDLQEPDAGVLLLRDGRNIASVLSWIERHNPQVKRRIEEYLGHIASGIQEVETKHFGHKESLVFKQTVIGDEHPWQFNAQNMSDGTLRAFGVLVSLFQSFDRPADVPIPLVGIEEPEATLHPAAALVLMDALQEAAHYTQVIATTHSTDLMDAKDIDPEGILVVNSHYGETVIAPVNEESKTAMRERLSTAGELLKLNLLGPQPGNGDSRHEDESTHPLFEHE